MNLRTLILTLLSQFLFGYLIAGTEINSIRIESSDISQGLIVQDPSYSSGVSNPGVGSRAIVVFGVDELYSGNLISAYSSTVNFDVKLYNANGVLTVSNSISLTVDYDPKGGPSQVTKDIYFRDNFYKMEVIVNSVTNSTKANLYLEGIIEVDRYYDIGSTAPQNSEVIHFGNSNNILTTGDVSSGVVVNAYEISWEGVEGAEYYELEYSYIDNYKYTVSSDSYTNYSASQITLSEEDFNSNNTRVSTSNTYYRLPAIYPRGYLVYRVRAVGFDENNLVQTENTLWSSDPSTTNSTVSDWQDYVEIVNQVDHRKNYQVITTFAEDGKKKEVMSLYDGSNRQRQTLTRLNSLEKTVVGETYYDYIGRQSLVLLPVPDDNDVLHYKKDFNVLSDNAAPTASDYDLESGSACEEGVFVFDSLYSGASHYYSSENNYSNFSDGIPMAEGYVYSKTVYKKDNTGRIKYQSSPGKVFRPGQKNTQYHYGKPEQNEINNLFGENVGSPNHYKKNLVVDPNGQASVSYLNPAGKTIATAMEGDSPTNMNIIDGNEQTSPSTVIIDVLNKESINDIDTESDNNYLVDNGYALESSEVILVSDAQDYDFTYSIGGNSGVTLECYSTMVVPLLLTFQLIDECGDDLFGEAYLEKPLSEVPFSNNELQMDNIGLDVGSYTLIKRLEIDPLALELLHQDYMEDVTTNCFSLDDYLVSNLGDYDSPCDFCDKSMSCLTEVGDTYGIYIQYNSSTGLYSVVLKAIIGDPPQGDPFEDGELTSHNLPDVFFDISGDPLLDELNAYLDAEVRECLSSTGNCDTLPDDLPSSAALLQQLLNDVGLFGQYGGEKLFEGEQVLFTTNPSGNYERTHLWDYTSVWSDAHKVINYDNGNPVVSTAYKNVYNHVNNSSLTSRYSWKYPNIPLGKTAGHYMDEWGMEYKIYLNFDGNDPYWDGVTGTDPSTQSDDIGYFMYPEQLASIVDFKEHWQAQWSENLVYYHPEYPIYEFYKLIGDLEYFSSSVTMSSDSFDNYLLKDFISGATGGPLESMTSYTASSYRLELINGQVLQDPFFDLDFDEVFPNLQSNDPDRLAFESLYNTYKAAMRQLLDNTAGSISGFEIENSELISNCSTYTIDLLDIANYFENCDNYSTISSICSEMDLPTTGIAITEGLFYKYVSMYQAEKQKMIYSLARKYADVVKDGYSTACIGGDENTTGFGFANFWSTFEYSPCDYMVAEYFDQKQRRIFPANEENSSTTSEEEEFINYTAEAEQNIYDETGLSLFTYSISQLFEQFLNEYEILDYDVDNNPSVSLSLSEMNGISSIVYFALASPTPINILENVMNGNMPLYENLEIQVDVVNSNLEIYIYGFLVASPYTRKLLRTFSLNIVSPSTGVSWNNYMHSNPQLSWKVTNFDLVIPDQPNTGELSVLANSICFDYVFCGEQIELSIESIQSGGAGTSFYHYDLTPEMSSHCESNEFLDEIIDLLNLFGQSNVDSDGGQLMFQSFPSDTYTRADYPDYSIDEIPTISDDLEKLETMAYYQLEQSNAIIEFFGGDITGFNISTTSGSGPNTVYFSFGVPGESYEFSISNFPTDDDYFDDYQLDSSTYENIGSQYDYKASVELYKYTNDTTYSTYTLRIEIRNTDLCEFFGSCDAPDDCSDCFESSSNPHFTECCKPWFMPIVTCEEAYDDYINTYIPAIASGYPICGDIYNDTIEKYIFCSQNLYLYWNDYKDYLDYIDCYTVITQGESVIDVYDINPLYITLFEFAQLNFQDFQDKYETFIDGILLEEMNGISFCTLLNNEYDFIADGEYSGSGFGDIPSLLTPQQFVSYNLSPSSITAFLNQIGGSTDYNIVEWIASNKGSYQDLPYCPPILPQNFELEGEPYEIEPCFDEFLANLDSSNVANEWAQIVEDYSNNFIGDFLDSAFAHFYEGLEYTYTKNTYHKTLYYYDLAGNLAQTVPPKGVQDNFVYNPTTSKYPAHNYKTQYKYNSFNQLIWQSTPDGGETFFYYDKLGRLVASQNANQSEESGSHPNQQYSYTIYDDLGRVSEVGVITSSDFNNASTKDFSQSMENGSWPPQHDGSLYIKSEIVKTYYDISPATSNYLPNSLEQENLRNRVSVTAVFENYSSSFSTYDQATFYSYDIHGNVKWLIQEIPEMASGDLAFKYMEYDYDLISGNVNQVSYQPGEVDQFYHKYTYDDDNRITDVYTSSDGLIWLNDARYLYYDHGPLARTELGENKVQGIDYFYTLQGWLKGVNSNDLTASISDLGQDNKPGGLNPYGSSDAFGFTLDYYAKDFASITSSSDYDYSPGNSTKYLYNGNIKGMNVAITQPSDNYINPASSTLLSGSTQTPITHKSYYTYDQLNRIKRMKEDASLFHSYYEYDENGNISKLWRFDENGNRFDRLVYYYYSGTNKLKRIVDQATTQTGNGSYNDLLTQSNNNYVYDEIGNLTKDVKEGISSIQWLANGKVKKVLKNAVSGNVDSEFLYDASGNRIVKESNVWASSSAYSTTLSSKQYYIRDASGNVMATYKELGTDPLKLTEQQIYGSSRLGVLNKDIDVSTTLSSTSTQFENGEKLYELSNHLGNVMQTITDHKIAYVYSGNLRFGAEVTSMSDYYPFGMRMFDRSSNSSLYRYSFQGQEQDDEIKGEGNSINYKYRMHDPRIGRFFAVDPLTAKYPHYTPYSFSGNKVIGHVELEGLEEVIVHHYHNTGEETKIETVKWSEIPGNLGSHGPRGSGTLHYHYNSPTSEKTVTNYVMSLEDIWNSFKGDYKYDRPPAEYTDIPGTDQGKGEDENVFENFGPQINKSGEETGDGYISEPKIRKDDSIRVQIWHYDEETNTGSYPIIKADPADTSNQKINGSGYGEFEGDEIIKPKSN